MGAVTSTTSGHLKNSSICMNSKRKRQKQVSKKLKTYRIRTGRLIKKSNLPLRKWKLLKWNVKLPESNRRK